MKDKKILNTRRFSDVHVHCLASLKDEKKIAERIDALIAQGLEKMFVIVTPKEKQGSWLLEKTTPPRVKDPAVSRSVDEAAWIEEFLKKYDLKETLIPFLDTRFLLRDIDRKIGHFYGKGFKGIKGVFLPKADKLLRVDGIPQTLGISLKDYYRIQQEIFQGARKYGLPVLYHISLLEYFDYFQNFLKDFPEIKINIPHIGYSRRNIGNLMDNFENCFTDPSFLASLFRNNRKRYHEFVVRYQDRVMMGSDSSLLDSTGAVLEYVELFEEMGLSPRVTKKILVENARNYLAGSH